MDSTGDASGTFTFTTPSTGAGNDVLAIDTLAAGENRISGTSGGVAFESVTFSNYAHVVINTGTNDQLGSQDNITFSGPLTAAGLQDLTVQTGSGNDTVDLAGLPQTNAVAINLNFG